MKKEETKCVVVHLPIVLVKKVDKYAADAGLAKGEAIRTLLEKGLSGKAAAER